MMLYSVIRYLPDPYAGEQINIGVVLFDSHGHVPPSVIGTEEWERVRAFARQQRITHVREFINSFQQRVKELWEEEPSGIEEYLRSCARDWWGIFRVTDPRPIDLEPDAAQRYAVETFLHHQDSRVTV